MRKRTPLAERLARSTQRDVSGCLLWTLRLTDEGYGYIWITELNTQRGVHRVAWELANGPIPEGWDVDHRCRVRHCVEPRHLEAVPKSTNAARSANGFALTGRCRSGRHEIKTDDDWLPKTGGGRLCKACQRERMAAWREKNRERIRADHTAWRRARDGA